MAEEEQGVDLSRRVRVEQGAVIKPSETPTNGHTRYHPLIIAAVAPVSVGVVALSWPYGVDIRDGRLYGISDDADGSLAQDAADSIKAYSDPGQVGALTQAATQEDTVLTVSSTVTDNVDPGDFILLGADTDLYEVVSKDAEAGTITLNSGISAGYDAATAVNMRRYYAGIPSQGLELGPGSHLLSWGNNMMDSTRIPAN